MAGVVGTVLMLLEASGLGGVVDLDALPRPVEVGLEDWLLAFPSYGFVLSVAAAEMDAVMGRFAARGIAAAAIGGTDESRVVRLRMGEDEAVLWRFADEALVGC